MGIWSLPNPLRAVRPGGWHDLAAALMEFQRHWLLKLMVAAARGEASSEALIRVDMGQENWLKVGREAWSVQLLLLRAAWGEPVREDEAFFACVGRLLDANRQIAGQLSKSEQRERKHWGLLAACLEEEVYRPRLRVYREAMLGGVRGLSGRLPEAAAFADAYAGAVPAGTPHGELAALSFWMGFHAMFREVGGGVERVDPLDVPAVAGAWPRWIRGFTQATQLIGRQAPRYVHLLGRNA